MRPPATSSARSHTWARASSPAPSACCWPWSAWQSRCPRAATTARRPQAGTATAAACRICAGAAASSWASWPSCCLANTAACCPLPLPSCSSRRWGTAATPPARRRCWRWACARSPPWCSGGPCNCRCRCFAGEADPMIDQSLQGLWYGFGVAFEHHNLLWSFFGVLVGNLIGVMPGMGALSAMSMLLPLTYVLHPVPAIMMLAGIFYGSMYGGAIGAILLNLPSHAAHAVTCLDGYPLTRAGKGGTALGIAMISSFFAASIGILVMVFASPLLVAISFKFGPAELFSIMLLGLLAGATMSRGSPLKGVAMTLFGLLCGVVGT